jgi:hypothetical protein
MFLSPPSTLLLLPLLLLLNGRERNKVRKEDMYIYIYTRKGRHTHCTAVNTLSYSYFTKTYFYFGQTSKEPGTKSVPKICSLGQPQNQSFRMRLREYLNLSFGFSGSRYTNIDSVIT